MMATVSYCPTCDCDGIAAGDDFETFDRAMLAAPNVPMTLCNDPWHVARTSQMARDLDMILQDARFSIEDMVAWLRQVIPPGSLQSEPVRSVWPQLLAPPPINQGGEAVGPAVRRALPRALCSLPCADYNNRCQAESNLTNMSRCSAAQYGAECHTGQPISMTFVS